MGQFSFITSDTKESISNLHANTVHMLDNKGNVWTEEKYEGYGEFGGKDFYELLAELNGLPSDRQEGIDLFFKDNNSGDEPSDDIIIPRLVRNKNISFDAVGFPKSCPHQGWCDADGTVSEEEYDDEEFYSDENY